MLAEMVRVTRPGGRVAVIVRALDASWWVNLPLQAALKAKVEIPGRVASGVAAGGCADGSIYRKFHREGLSQLFQQQFLAVLDPEEAVEWRRAVAEAEADGTFFMAQPFHCAVGIKP
jgi:hypothetical protein